MILMLLLGALQTRAPGDSITLADAMALARTHRAQTVAATARVEEARAGLAAAGAIPNPSFSYGYSDAVPTNHLVLDQSLEWLLHRGSDRAAARAGVTRAVADSTQTITFLLRDVRVAFWRARAAHLSQTLVEDQARQADSLAHIAGARYQAGDVSQLESEQAAQEAARVHQDVSVAREQARIAASELGRALGLEIAPTPVGALDAGLDFDMRGSIDPQSTPPLRAAVADSAAAAATAHSASIGRVPLPTVQVGAEWGDPGQRGMLALIGFSLPLPLWQRGSAPVRVARARASQAAAAAREARLDALRDIAQARIHLDETAGRARVARDSLVPAAGALRSRAFRAYEAGETGIVPVLDALRSEHGVRLDGLRDELAFQEAAAAWDALRGRLE